ncbi:MAG: porin, partial [Alphaproteobacteria bacterium]
MKKGLLGTTALVAASVAMTGLAEAAKPKVSVKGAFNIQAAFIDQDQEGLSSSSNAVNSVATDRGISIVTDSEIKIRAQGKTDAGMNWRATLEIESDGSKGGGTVARRVADDSHLRLWGSWGMLMLGAIDGAGDKMSYNSGKWTYGTGGSNGKWPRYVNRKSVNTRFHTSPKGRDSGDSAKIVYYTPRMAGFQAGVGWAPDREDEGAQRSGINDSEENFFEVGVNYKGK